MNGSIVGIFSKPITFVIAASCVVMLVYPLIKMFISKKINVLYKHYK